MESTINYNSDNLTTNQVEIRGFADCCDGFQCGGWLLSFERTTVETTNPAYNGSYLPGVD
jgi:hypothetical protein